MQLLSNEMELMLHIRRPKLNTKERMRRVFLQFTSTFEVSSKQIKDKTPEQISTQQRYAGPKNDPV